MSKSFYFIVNARIGTKKIETLKSSINHYLKEFEYEIHITHYGGHAKILTKEGVEKKFETIVAVGGDGTVNEVIQELANTNITLAIIPTGSGNGLARH